MSDASERLWDERLDQFWTAFDPSDAVQAHAALSAILTERGSDDARAAYERASVHDALGEEEEAAPFYRAALDGDLRPDLRTQATIQLASTLRNLGDASGAMALLRSVPVDDPLSDAALAFLALALFSDEKPAPALRTALQTLAPHLPRYTRAVGAYAGELQAPRRMRTIAVALLIRDGWVLAEEYPGHGTPGDGFSGPFLRAPGGGVEFGERAEAAIHREVREELGVRIDSAELLGVVENIFDAYGRAGHEIAFVYRIRSAALEELPRSKTLPVLDSDTRVGWYEIATLGERHLPFYPEGCLDLAR